MRQSKYVRDPIDIMKMTNAELKSYIRAASKSFSKRIKEIEQLPNSGASETMQFLKQSGNIFRAGRSRFATRGLSRDELIAKAQGVNVLAGLNETASKFRRIVEEEIQNIIDEGFSEDITPEDIAEMFNNRDAFESLRDYVDVHMDSIYALLGSERVSELADEYEDDSNGFYTAMLKEAIKEYQETEKPAREKFFKEKRREKTRFHSFRGK